MQTDVETEDNCPDILHQYFLYNTATKLKPANSACKQNYNVVHRISWQNLTSEMASYSQIDCLNKTHKTLRSYQETKDPKKLIYMSPSVQISVILDTCMTFHERRAVTVIFLYFILWPQEEVGTHHTFVVSYNMFQLRYLTFLNSPVFIHLLVFLHWPVFTSKVTTRRRKNKKIKRSNIWWLNEPKLLQCHKYIFRDHILCLVQHLY
jgi:hypothetical protein